ncbi:hypothetical protein [Hymenobacter sp. 102]|uniref:hypothetical protein n=1 Tax=Hymenobacter sp. 102 TaxID=3403152 RepID=UPI003CF318E3
MLHHLKALALFYRSVLGYTLAVSGLIIGSSLLPMFGNWPPRLVPLLLLKLITFPPVIYLLSQFRPHQYWFYRNLHLSPWQLWGSALLLDGVVFVLLVEAARLLIP